MRQPGGCIQGSEAASWDWGWAGEGFQSAPGSPPRSPAPRNGGKEKRKHKRKEVQEMDPGVYSSSVPSRTGSVPDKSTPRKQTVHVESGESYRKGQEAWQEGSRAEDSGGYWLGDEERW